MKASPPADAGSGPIRDYRTLPGPPALPLLGSALRASSSSTTRSGGASAGS
nr:hypothetical protein [Schlegelella koreensis]